MGATQSRLTPNEAALLTRETGLSSEELNRWYARFRFEHKSGLVSKEDFIEGNMKSSGIRDRALWEHVFQLHDSDGNGLISFREFISGLASMTSDNPETKIHWLFNLYDRDGTGQLSRGEVTDIVRSIVRMQVGGGQDKDVTWDMDRHVHRRWHGSVESITSEVVAGIFARLDSDCNGVISRDEFRSACLADRDGRILKALSIF